MDDRAIWRETTPPVMGDLNVRIVPTNVALVDATESRIGSVSLKQESPVLLVLLRVAGQWRIATIR